jgi:ornithine decarboxylase
MENKQHAKKTKGVIGKEDFDPKFLRSLAHKTPYFLFSKQKILNNLKEFKKFFPGSAVHYAMKANSEKGVLKILADAGAGFEVASKHELDWLKELKVAPEKIIYGTSVKPAEHIKDFFKYGVKRFAADSVQELEKIAQLAPRSKVYIRTVANDSGSVFKFSEKFGTDPSSIIPLLIRAKELGLHPYGISFHVGSQASDAKAWANMLIILRSVISDLLDEGIKLDAINLGGGFPCVYASSEVVPGLSEIANNTLEQYNKLPYLPKLIVEPGRGIIANTAVLIASVIARVERRGNTWLFLDAGTYNGLFESMSYQGSIRYTVTPMRPVGDAGEALFELAGPTGDSPDVISRESLLPRDIQVGDKLIFHNVGAYNLFFVSTHNGFPKPDVYYM